MSMDPSAAKESESTGENSIDSGYSIFYKTACAPSNQLMSAYAFM